MKPRRRPSGQASPRAGGAPQGLPALLATREAVALHLARLLELDPRLEAVYRAAGEVLPRVRAPGFAGLARIVCGQQVSVASAAAIWGRLESLPGGTTPEGFLALRAADLKTVGLSRSKHATLAALAQALAEKRLDLEQVARLPVEAAVAELTRHKGIGPWTAEIYLMFCAAHPDIFPAGDLALRKAVGEAFGIEPCPDRETVAGIAARWAPHRASAALLFWSFYAARRARQAIPV